MVRNFWVVITQNKNVFFRGRNKNGSFCGQRFSGWGVVAFSLNWRHKRFCVTEPQCRLVVANHPVSQPARRCRLDQRAGINERASTHPCRCQPATNRQLFAIAPAVCLFEGAACQPKAQSSSKRRLEVSGPKSTNIFDSLQTLNHAEKGSKTVRQLMLNLVGLGLVVKLRRVNVDNAHGGVHSRLPH